MKKLFAACLALVTLAFAAGARIEPSLVLVNGKIWTADQPRWIEAAAVLGDRFVALGTTAEIRALAGPGTQVIDLKGRMAVPGFIDNHTHFSNGGFQLLGVDLRSARNEQEFADRIVAHAARLPAGTWITRGDWDHEAWPTARIPRRALIDDETGDHPVFVNRLDGHMALANRRALELAGIDRNTADPPGGTIVRDEVTGEPTGMLKDAAMALVERVIPQPSPQRRLEAARAALAEARRLGVTGIHDMSSFADLKTYQELLRRGELTTRIYAITPLPEWKRMADAGIEQGFGGEMLRTGALKGFMDGSLGSTTAWFYEPFNDEPTTSGLPSAMWFPEGNVKKMVSAADKAGLQVAIHAIGDKANHTLLEIYGQVIEDNGARDRRFRIEHAQHLLPADYALFAKLRVIASMQPYHAIDDGRWAEKRIGPKRIRSTYAFRSLLDAGARLTFGSDWSVAPLSPLLGVYAAVTRRTLDDKNPSGWVPEQRISVEEALFAYTFNNAYGSFEEKVKGSVAVGKLADLVVLSEHLMEIPPEKIKEAQVDLTLLGGRIVYARK
ncbi:MAG: amidohydrolase [Acidobacteriota bacterium]